METRYSSRKEKNLGIPAIVRIGVSGHRKLASTNHLRESVKEVLSKLDTMLSQMLTHTSHQFIAVSALAEGADRLIAEEILNWPVAEEENKPELEVVLPMPVADYLQDFETQESKDEFKAFLDRAKSVRAFENVKEPRTAAYGLAGRNVVENCDVLIALWD
jgi:glutaredoxin-related protein